MRVRVREHRECVCGWNGVGRVEWRGRVVCMCSPSLQRGPCSGHPQLPPHIVVDFSSLLQSSSVPLKVLSPLSPLPSLFPPPPSLPPSPPSSLPPLPPTLPPPFLPLPPSISSFPPSLPPSPCSLSSPHPPSLLPSPPRVQQHTYTLYSPQQMLTAP